MTMPIAIDDSDAYRDGHAGKQTAMMPVHALVLMMVIIIFMMSTI